MLQLTALAMALEMISTISLSALTMQRKYRSLIAMLADSHRITQDQRLIAQARSVTEDLLARLPAQVRDQETKTVAIAIGNASIVRANRNRGRTNKLPSTMPSDRHRGNA